MGAGSVPQWYSPWLESPALQKKKTVEDAGGVGLGYQKIKNSAREKK
jgi:hypothetical protein